MDLIVRKKILKSEGGRPEKTEDSVAVEKKLRISVKGKELLSLYCTPSMLRELIVGFFLTEGVVRGKFCFEDISFEFGEDIRADIPALGEFATEGFTITSGCVGGITFNRNRDFGRTTDPFSLKAASLEKVFRQFQRSGELYRQTGCVHSAALSDGESILVFAEDIGRHNAVDKVIGHAIINDIPLTAKLMLVSGRLSSEIASKCARWGVPIVASRTAPTDLAIQIAEASGVTLAGFVRGDRMNVYTHPLRIIL